MKRLAVCLLLASCGVDGGECGPVVDEAAWIAGEYAPPSVPVLYEELGMPGGVGTISQVRFDADVPRSPRTVWWSGPDDLALRWQFALARNDGSLRDARVVLLLDGLQLSYLDDTGQRVDFAPLRIEPSSSGELALHIAAADVTKGAHSLVIVAIDPRGSVWKGEALTLIRDGDARFTPRPDHTAQASFARGDGSSFVSVGDSPFYLDKPLPVTAQGSLPLRAMSPISAAEQMCSGERAAKSFTVLVDFRQRTMDGFGPFARVLVERDQAAVVKTELRGLPPPDGQRHVVTVLEVEGDGSYGEDPPGTFAGRVGRPGSLANGFY